VSMEVKNKALVRRFLEAHAKGDLDALEEMMTPDFVNHSLLPSQEPARAICSQPPSIMPPSPTSATTSRSS
jgi:ketosteroid isomerase-like protein